MSEATSGTVLTASTRISLRSCGRQPALSAAIFPRHARARRARRGHPRLWCNKQDVDGRDKCLARRHDHEGAENTSNVLSRMENPEKLFISLSRLLTVGDFHHKS